MKFSVRSCEASRDLTSRRKLSSPWQASSRNAARSAGARSTADWKRSLTCFQRSAFIRFLPRSALDKARPWPWSTPAPRCDERVSGIQLSLRPSNHRSTAVQRSDFYACPARPNFPTLHRERVIPPTAFLLLTRSEEHTSELQSRGHLVCRLLLEKKKK